MSVANETRNSVSLEEVKTFRAPIDPLARRSVICAWLFFLTPIAPVLAVVFGLLAIGKSRGRDERSASRATIATFVGLTALIGWIFASYAALQIYQQIQGIKSFSNQRVLGFYLLNYAEAHNQQLPDSWAELVADSDNPNLVAGTVPQDVAKFLVSPASGNKPATGPTTQAVLKDLASGEHISYLYLGQGLNLNRLKSPTTIPIAVEIGRQYSDGTLVLFADGHSESVNRNQLLSILQQRWDETFTVPATFPSH